jgi:phospholipase C
MKSNTLLACCAAAFAVVTTSAGADDFSTRTPIKHLVVIFNENISFDHYFGTYPHAKNTDGTTFTASPRTPKSINTLETPLDTSNHFQPLAGLNLLTNNPNLNPANGTGSSNPLRLAPSQAGTSDQGHNDKPEQGAYDNGKMDLFPLNTGVSGPPPLGVTTAALVMGYFDGNTVTALWHYAQHFALNDNHYTSQFGPSTPGALNLISGQTNGFSASSGTNTFSASHEVADGGGDFTMIGDADPLDDVCSTANDRVQMKGRNIGDLLNARGITWGWFEGGFDLTITNPNGTTGCARSSTTAPGAFPTPVTSADYIPHHQPFQYYASTANPNHSRPSSVAAIGYSLIPKTTTPDPANHQYDTTDFFAALNAHHMPAVSFIKPPAFQDGHAGYSDPLDEQTFLVDLINTLESSPEWAETAVVIEYDDSDGWYDHQMPPIVNPSFTAADVLNGPGTCNRGVQQPGTPTVPGNTPRLNGVTTLNAQGRCGLGTRIPFLVVSPFAKSNHVDHTLTDQSSILRFIEDNWLAGERIQVGGSFDTIAGPIDPMFDFDARHEEEPRKLILNPTSGAVVSIAGERGGDGD